MKKPARETALAPLVPLSSKVTVCSECGEPLSVTAVHVHPGPRCAETLIYAREGRRDRREAVADRKSKPLVTMRTVPAAQGRLPFRGYSKWRLDAGISACADVGCRVATSFIAELIC